MQHGVHVKGPAGGARGGFGCLHKSVPLPNEPRVLGPEENERVELNGLPQTSALPCDHNQSPQAAESLSDSIPRCDAVLWWIHEHEGCRAL